MKSLFAILLLVGAVAAQQTSDGRALAEALEKRGEALLESTKKTLQELNQSGNFHLAGALDHQVVLVEALVLDLKAQLADKTKQHSAHHVHVIEEDLLHLENSIVDELVVINQIRNNHQSQGDNHSQLTTRGENLIKTAKESLSHHANTPEARDIQREVTAVEQLIKALAIAPQTADLKKTEEQLARHEKTLQQLLEKAANRPISHPVIVHHGF